jgi:tRNA-specific 2-thiouridylase
MGKENITVAVGMSGGVDSALAAALLKKQGYNVIGLTMEIFSGEDNGEKATSHACYGPGEEEDVRLAKEVADFLKIPYFALDLREEYKKSVLEYFTGEYLSGRTPNPCTRCNPVMKFGSLLQKARNSGISFDLFATGHYVRVCYMEDRKRYVLKRAVDTKKDQSYFLYGIPAEQLATLLFPLGGFTKEEVREQAEKIALPVAARPESQDFIEGGDYSGLFEKEKVTSGPIMDIDGNHLGTHKGIINYTIGQRRGLGIACGEPRYVVNIDAEKNTIILGPKEHLYSDTLIAGHINLLSIDTPAEPMKVQTKIRQAHKPADSKLSPLSDGTFHVVFDSPQLSITPGQAVVFYDGEVVLGGGIIE